MTDARSGMMKGVRILCALALLFVGFAHKVPSLGADAVQPAYLSQYVFPDGTPHVLCLPGEDGDGGHAGPDIGLGCEACRLTASILAPAPGDTAGWLIRLPAGNGFAPLRAEAPRQPLLLPNAAPRGPPSGTIAAIAAASSAAVPARAG